MKRQKKRVHPDGGRYLGGCHGMPIKKCMLLLFIIVCFSQVINAIPINNIYTPFNESTGNIFENSEWGHQIIANINTSIIYVYIHNNTYANSGTLRLRIRDENGSVIYSSENIVTADLFSFGLKYYNLTKSPVRLQKGLTYYVGIYGADMQMTFILSGDYPIPQHDLNYTSGYIAFTNPDYSLQSQARVIQDIVTDDALTPSATLTSPLADGLISYYNMSDTSDVINVWQLGNSGFTFIPDGKIGGCAYSSDDTTQYMDIDFLYPQPANISINLWVNLSSSTFIFRRENAFAGSWDTYAYYAYDDYAHFYTAGNGENEDNLLAGNTGNEITNTGWNMITVTYNGTDKNIYFNGVLANTSSYPFGLFYGGDFPTVIGKSVDAAANGFIGCIDELGIWGRPLNSSEVSQLYNDGAGLAYPYMRNLSTILTEEWDFEESSGDFIGGKAGIHLTPHAPIDYNVLGINGFGVNLPDFSNSFLNTYNSSLDIDGTNFSLSLWFRNPTDGSTLWLKCAALNTAECPYIYVSPAGFSEFIRVSRFSDDDGISYIISPDQWYNLIVTYDESTLTSNTYVDGTLIDTHVWGEWGSSFATGSNGGDWANGGESDIGFGILSNFTLDLEQVFIGTVLSQAEVSQLYNNGSGYPLANLTNATNETNATIVQAFNVSITPDHFYPTSTLQGYCAGNSTDNTTSITFYYKWLINGVVVNNGSVGVFPQNTIINVANYTLNATIGDIVTFACNASDGISSSGYVTYPPPSYCYQESANVSNQTGMDGNCRLTYSGVISTLNGTKDLVMINYTKPVGATSAAWQVKQGAPIYAPPTPYNVSVPSSCLNQSVLQFKLLSEPTIGYGQCYNGTDWQTITNIASGAAALGYTTSSPDMIFDGNWSTAASWSAAYNNFWESCAFSIGGCSGAGMWFEEAIWWNISTPVLSLNIFFNPNTATNGSYLSGGIMVNVTSLTDFLTLNSIYLYNGTLLFQNVSAQSTFAINYTGLPDGVYKFNATTINTFGDAFSTETRQVTIINTFKNQSYNVTFPHANNAYTNNNTLTYGFNTTDTNYNYTIYTINTLSTPQESQCAISTPYWYVDFNNVTSYANNTIINGYNVNGTILYDATGTFTSFNGLNGNAVFSIDNNIRILFNDSNNKPTAFSISIWVYPNSSSSTSFLYRPRGSQTDSLVSFNLAPTSIMDNLALGTPITCAAPMPIQNNVWNNYVLTFNGSNLLCYHNGNQSVSSRPNNYSVSYNGNFSSVLGYLDNHPEQTLYGGYDEYGFWNTELTSCQIQRIYNEHLVFNGTAFNGAPTLTSTTNTTITITLADGKYYYGLTIYDKAGNNKFYDPNVTIDTTPPSIAFNNTGTPANGVYINQSFINYRVDVFDINLNYTIVNLYNATGGLIQSANSTLNTTQGNFSTLADGVYLFNATVYDLANNINSTETRQVTIDTTPPSISFNPNGTTANGVYLNQPFIHTQIVVNDTNLNVTILNIYHSGILVINRTLLPNETSRGICYQEFANETPCGNPGVGGYITMNLSSPIQVYDGNWSTGTTPSPNPGALYINYSKPLAANITGSVWQEKDIGSGTPTTTNYTIPLACWNQLTLQFRIIINSNLGGLVSGTCFNSTSWISIFDHGFAGFTLYEEAMYWNVPDAPIIQTSLIYNVTPIDGPYQFNATAFDLADPTNSTPTINVTLDTTIPSITFNNSNTPINGTAYNNQTFINYRVDVNDTNLNYTIVHLYNSTGGLTQSANSTANTITGNFSGLAFDTYHLNATVYDLANNSNSTETRTIIIYSILPGVFISPTFNQSINNSLLINWTTPNTTGSSIVKYIIELWNNDTTLNRTIANITNVTNSTNTTYNWIDIYNITLTVGQQYFINMKAIDQFNMTIQWQQLIVPQYNGYLNITAHNGFLGYQLENFTTSISGDANGVRNQTANTTQVQYDIVRGVNYSITSTLTDYIPTTVMYTPVNKTNLLNMTMDQSGITLVFRHAFSNQIINNANITIRDITDNLTFTTTNGILNFAPTAGTKLLNITTSQYIENDYTLIVTGAQSASYDILLFPILNLKIYDEKLSMVNLTIFNFTHPQASRFTVFCTNNVTIQTLIANTTNSPLTLNVTCPYSKVRFDLQYLNIDGTTTIYYRTLIFPSTITQFNFSVFLPDLKTTTIVQDFLSPYDIFGVYVPANDAVVTVTKIMPTGVELIHSDFVDAAGKITAYLIQGDQYIITVTASGAPARVLGPFNADQSGSQVLRLFGIVLSGNEQSTATTVVQTTTVQTVTQNQSLLVMHYADPGNFTASVTMALYNGTCTDTRLTTSCAVTSGPGCILLASVTPFTGLNNTGDIYMTYNIFGAPYQNGTSNIAFCSVQNATYKDFTISNTADTTVYDQAILLPARFNNPFTFSWLIIILLVIIALGLNTRTVSFGSLLITALASILYGWQWYARAVPPGVAVGVPVSVALLIAIGMVIKRGMTIG